MQRLVGRKVVVTGAASGIGLATAILCKQEGADVFLIDRNGAAFRDVSGFAESHQAVADIAREDQVLAAIEAAGKVMGGIDGLVHCAGIGALAGLEDTTLEMWNEIMSVNLTGAFLVCRAALPWLRRNDSASIVTVSSAAGLLPSAEATVVAYAASKAGLQGFTRAIARELGPKIRANVVCPGQVDTPMTRLDPRSEEEKKAAWARQYTLQRSAAPEELAKSLVFLLSDDASYITGATVAVDGGRTFH